LQIKSRWQYRLAREKVRAFYNGILGLKEVTPPEAVSGAYDIPWFQWLDILLRIYLSPPWVKPAENRHVAVEVSNIRAIKEYLEEQAQKFGKPWSFQTGCVCMFWIRLGTISSSSK